MRSTLLCLALLTLVACDSDSDNIVTGAPETATLELDPRFEDYGASFAADGHKGVFVSQRDQGERKVYVYDADTEAKRTRLNDRLPAASQNSDASETFAVISPSATWIAFAREEAGVTKIVTLPYAGADAAEISVAAPLVVSDLSFAQGSDEYFAYVESSGYAKTVKVIKVAGDASQVTVSESQAFPGEDQPELISVGGVLQLVTLTADPASVQKIVKRRTLDSGTGTWTLVSDDSLALSLKQSDRPWFVSEAGLFSTADLDPVRLRLRVGPGTSGQTSVVVSDTPRQADLFATAQSYDFSSPTYLANESLVIAGLSGSADGQYLVTIGTDSLACKIGVQQLPVAKIVRRSDMKTINFMLSRKVSDVGPAWTGASSDVCGIADQTLADGPYAFDIRMQKAQWVGMDGNKFVVLIETKVTFDRELRLAKFAVDWDSGVISGVEIQEVSLNSSVAQ